MSESAPVSKVEPLHQTNLSGGSLNRLHDQRTDEDWLRSQRSSGRVHVTWQGNVVVQTSGDGTIELATIEALHSPRPEHHVLLGELHGELHWALDVSDHAKEQVQTILPTAASITTLRDVGAKLSEDHANLIAFATGMGHWHRTHLFCGSCGGSTELTTGGHERKCTDCGQIHWPRTDPAVIMLTIDTQNDRALLGRQKIWPPKMYSTLAGFVEPGESLEDAVARETFEEAGVRIGKVRYWCSQPWPFPRSVMLGFHAQYSSGEVRPHPTEMDDVRWFTREELLEARAEASVPPILTISRVLIDAWLDEKVSLSATKLISNAQLPAFGG